VTIAPIGRERDHHIGSKSTNMVDYSPDRFLGIRLLYMAVSIIEKRYIGDPNGGTGAA
jgi:hypothetical protein